MGNRIKEIKARSYINIDGKLMEVKDLNEEQQQYIGTLIKINLNRNRLGSLNITQLPSEKLRSFDEIFK
ncbi:MAG: hypothetical protein VB078_11605 [Clostridiaceae bacterium]|nr:hypothetical protein [Clostridiaceae bacterium]